MSIASIDSYTFWNTFWSESKLTVYATACC